MLFLLEPIRASVGFFDVVANNKFKEPAASALRLT
jgi:hypothetical protein